MVIDGADESRVAVINMLAFSGQTKNQRSDGMSKEIACTNVVPGCKTTVRADTEEELLQKVAEHARKDHGVTEVSPELLAKVKAAVVTR